MYTFNFKRRLFYKLIFIFCEFNLKEKSISGIINLGKLKDPLKYVYPEHRCAWYRKIVNVIKWNCCIYYVGRYYIWFSKKGNISFSTLFYSKNGCWSFTIIYFFVSNYFLCMIYIIVQLYMLFAQVAIDFSNNFLSIIWVFM